jgi:hypothetical protein
MAARKFREELMAPVQRPSDGLVAGIWPATATQQSQVIIEPVDNLLGRQDANPGRGQLDRQRDAVHPSNDRLHRSGGIVAQLEP